MQAAGKPMQHTANTWNNDRDTGNLSRVTITRRVDLAQALAGPA